MQGVMGGEREKGVFEEVGENNNEWKVGSVKGGGLGGGNEVGGGEGWGRDHEWGRQAEGIGEGDGDEF
ncbi:hypothetical protein, partial [Neisseria sicca]|uniref:hypothetical protein n=1 Tax=Neisseria sicca TaxID=490 RepID=UPI001C99B27D